MSTPADPMVLVHPEAFPDLYWTVDADAYGSEVTAAAEGVRKVVILDSSAMEDVQEYEDDEDHVYEITDGVPVTGWEIVQADPHELAKVCGPLAATFAPTARVAVGGFHRFDCVARVVAHLREAGIDAYLHEATTLPYANDPRMGADDLP